MQVDKESLSDQSFGFCFRLEFLLLLRRMTLSCCSSYGAHSPKIQKSSAWKCLNADTAAFKLDLQVRIKENMAQNLLHFSKSYRVLLLFWRQQQVLPSPLLPFTFKNHAHCCGRALMPAYVWENVDMLPGLFHASTAFTTLVCVPFSRAAHVGDARLCSQQEKRRGERGENRKAHVDRAAGDKCHGSPRSHRVYWATFGMWQQPKQKG